MSPTNPHEERMRVVKHERQEASDWGEVRELVIDDRFAEVRSTFQRNEYGQADYRIFLADYVNPAGVRRWAVVVIDPADTYVRDTDSQFDARRCYEGTVRDLTAVHCDPNGATGFSWNFTDVRGLPPGAAHQFDPEGMPVVQRLNPKGDEFAVAGDPLPHWKALGRLCLDYEVTEDEARHALDTAPAEVHPY